MCVVGGWGYQPGISLEGGAAAADPSRLSRLFDEYLDEYNLNSSKPMSLVFFEDHCAHLTRIIRILRQPRGNALLVGLGGSGKQSLTRLAAGIQECRCFQIEVVKNYDIQAFRADLGVLYGPGAARGRYHHPQCHASTTIGVAII